MTKIINKMGIDWKYLAAISVAILSPFVYNWIRIYWVVDQGSTTLAMTSFHTYLQMTMEIMAAFLLVPLFTYKNKEYKNNSFSIFVSISSVMIIFVFVGLLISSILITPMQKLNPTENSSTLMMYLSFQTVTSVLVIYEQYLLSDVIIEKKENRAYIFALTSILIKLSIDILLLSNISIIEPTLVTISLSSMISSIIVCSILFIMHINKYDDENERTFDLIKLKQYFLKGVIPASELLIRNLCYSFVTLQALLMLGENEWNSWNMGGYIYWMIIFKFTSIIEYYLLSEIINSNGSTSNKRVFNFYLIEFIFISLSGILLSVTYLPSILEDNNWKREAIVLSLANIPVMLFIGLQNIVKTKIVAMDKYIYMLYGTIINFLLLYLPVIIIIYGTNIVVSYCDNFAIFGLSCIIPTLVNVFCLLINVNEKLLLILKRVRTKKEC